MFVHLPTLGKILDSKDIAGVDTTFDIETKHSAVFPEHSTQPFYILTESVANAHISIKTKTGETFNYTTVVLPLDHKQQEFNNSVVIASMPEESQQKMLGLVQRCTNYMSKSENHAAMLAMRESTFSGIASTNEEAEGPRPTFMRASAHDDKDIADQGIRVKNMAKYLDKMSSIHTGLDYTAAMQHIDQGSVLAPLHTELADLTGILNNA